MRRRISFIVLFLMLLLAARANADTVLMKDGTAVDGIIKKVVKGQVVVEVGKETKVFDILDIESMDFTTPHVEGAVEGEAVDHFLKNVEAQEIVENMQQLEKTEAEIQKLIVQIRTYWQEREPITPREIPSWEAAKETFHEPLSKYQELLNDLYLHVLAKVDRYNVLMQAASDIYIGVRGPFNVGSPLVPKEMKQLPLKKYVPGGWYATIFYEGYNRGFDDAHMKYAIPSNPYQ
jgi:hypothetical protein